MSRKTISVESILATTNAMLANSYADTGGVRQGYINLLETVLHDTGNYNGFIYLCQNEVPEGEKPGVNFTADGVLCDETVRFINTDETRRKYF